MKLAKWFSDKFSNSFAYNITVAYFGPIMLSNFKYLECLFFVLSHLMLCDHTHDLPPPPPNFLGGKKIKVVYYFDRALL